MLMLAEKKSKSRKAQPVKICGGSDEEPRSGAARRLSNDGECFALGSRHRRDPRFDDARFLARNFPKGVSEPFCVIFSDGGDGAHANVPENVGGIEPTAEPDL